MDKFNIRPPEIHQDAFTEALREVIRKYKPKTILDVGASDGQGSTTFFSSFGVKVFALEVMEERFKALKERFKDNKKVFCYNYPASAYVMPTERVWQLYRRFPLWSCWKTLGIFEMVKWRDNTQSMIDAHKTPNGIQEIKRKHKVKTFGLACLDGGEFTGESELEDVYGAKIIALDDIRGCKNFDNHKRLAKDPKYVMAAYDVDYRNGFSIFVRV